MSRHSSNRQTPSRTRRGPAGRHAPHLGALACAIAAAFGAAGPAMLAATATPAAAAADLRHATVRPAAVPPGWQQVAYAGVTLRVPASWPVVDLAANPMTCPLLDVHTVYLGQPGPDPACPAAGLAGKTEAVQIMPLNPVSPDALAATQPVVLGGTQARTNPDPGTTHTIIDVFPAADREVTLSYGTDHAVIAQVQSSIQVGANVQAQAGPAPAAAAPAATAQGVYQGGGFDACAAPASGTMNAWLASPYRAIGVYIGGINRACAQANLTGSWITTIQGQGWHYFPLYPGLQASCGPAGNATIDPANAASEGTSAAADAVTQAQNLGIPASTPIVYDMEAYSGCASEVITYLSAWDSELHALGYAAGVYESFSDVSDLINANGSMTEPDIIDYAAWDGVATTNSSYLTSSMWTSHQRIHQYAGGHSETWGGQTINIDNNQLDANLGGFSLGDHGGFHVAVAINTSTTAEWFARGADGTLVHDFQAPSGNDGWSGVSALGASPANILSNPSVVPNQDGHLEVFAASTSGAVVHAWQGSGGTGGWVWGGSAGGTGSPGAIKGDPAAILRPDGDVAVFVTDADGTVATTAQNGPNGAGGWSAWTNIGGSCGGWPVPFVNSAKVLELLCRTTSGTVAMNTWNGSAWTGWATVGASPANLTADPAAVSNADGHSELFATTTSGSIDHAWQNADGSWNWGVPLTTNSAGAGVSNTPSAIGWPDGRVEVFFQLTDGQLGHAYQYAANGATGWSPVTSIGGTVLGSPHGWVNASGTPEIAALDLDHAVAHNYWTGSSWIGWVELGGSF